MSASSSSFWIVDRNLDGSRCVVQLVGELDGRASPGLRAFLDEQCILSEKIVLDLAKLTAIDASGIGVILDAHKKCADRGGVLTATAASPEVQQVLQRVLEITELQRIGPFQTESEPLGNNADLRENEIAQGNGSPKPSERLRSR